MAFEIRELVIRAVVDSAPAGAGGGAGSAPVSGAALVNDCVEQVLEILRRREER